MLTTCARSLRAPNSVSAIKTSLYSIQNVRLSSSATTATGGASKQAVDHLGTYDSSYEEYKIPDGDPDRRQFAYLALGGARFFYASAIRLAVMRFVGSMSASSDVLALASLEVDLGKIPVGQTATVKWRGKPVFVRNRTEEEIELAQKVDVSSLRHQEQDSERVKPGKEQWLVALGVCTHLGCVPISNAGEYHGWFCPCHGSHYDTSGRIRKGPAPLNLEVPPYKFIEGDSKLLIG